MQLTYFKAVKKVLQRQLGDEETKSLLERAVYFISIGGNDYSSFYAISPNANENIRQEFAASVISKLTIVLQVNFYLTTLI